ncbi:hypothetical protein ON010_g1716 [Phytophthora cinnamomi]|nr:hypothetical protein ON010_g1716 [Phytophthora cinnamomi]
MCPRGGRTGAPRRQVPGARDARAVRDQEARGRALRHDGAAQRAGRGVAPRALVRRVPQAAAAAAQEAAARPLLRRRLPVALRVPQELLPQEDRLLLQRPRRGAAQAVARAVLRRALRLPVGPQELLLLRGHDHVRRRARRVHLRRRAAPVRAREPRQVLGAGARGPDVAAQEERRLQHQVGRADHAPEAAAHGARVVGQAAAVQQAVVAHQLAARVRDGRRRRERPQRWQLRDLRVRAVWRRVRQLHVVLGAHGVQSVRGRQQQIHWLERWATALAEQQQQQQHGQQQWRVHPAVVRDAQAFR